MSPVPKGAPSRREGPHIIPDKLLNEELQRQVEDVRVRYEEDPLCGMQAKLDIIFSDESGTMHKPLFLDEERFEVGAAITYYAEELAVANKQLLAVYVATRLEVLDAFKRGWSSPSVNIPARLSPMLVAGTTSDSRSGSALIKFARRPNGGARLSRTQYHLFAPHGGGHDHALLQLFVEIYDESMGNDYSLRAPVVFT